MKRWLRKLSHPGVTALFAAFLFVDMFVAKVHYTECGLSLNADFRFDNGAPRLIDPYSEELDDGPVDGSVWMVSYVHRAGIWAVTSTEERVRFSHYVAPALPATQQAALERQFADVLEGRPEWAGALQVIREGPRRRTVWLGYLHNFVAAAALFGLIASLRWVPESRREAITRERLRESRCPRCEYDIRGVSGRCPECGAGLPGPSATLPPS